ncbi:hypothetical protein Bca52824_095030 [Brassica carinata]|uniref:Uncharacterized protein n=1 Tax=Brassica carinata TaxID=52824 RepID=A0A8X7P2U1_BRACI|nr:hypothetical protein Bca52824_095030 [Brassica carinata]
MILLGEIANGAMIRMRMEGRWWCSSERNIWRLCVVRWRLSESGRTNPSSNKGSGSSTNKQRTANPPSTFEDS